MEVLFKDDKFLYIIKYDALYRDVIKPDTDLTNIPHLKDAEVLYHYRSIQGNLFPVYYEHNNFFISFSAYEYLILDTDDYTKDYTSTNLNLI